MNHDATTILNAFEAAHGTKLALADYAARLRAALADALAALESGPHHRDPALLGQVVTHEVVVRLGLPPLEKP